MTHNHSWAPTIEKVRGTRHLTTGNQQQTDSDTPQPTVNNRQPTLDNQQQAIATDRYNRQTKQMARVKQKCEHCQLTEIRENVQLGTISQKTFMKITILF
jgi:ribosomal protein S3AE